MIKSVKRDVSFIVETDDKEYPTYRRYENGGWEQLMGDSWEPCFINEDKLEQMFQEYKQEEKLGR